MQPIIKNGLVTGKKKRLLLFVLFALIFTACTGKESMVLPVIGDYYTEVAVTEKKNLKLGVVTGPYGDMFFDAIMPSLTQKGYSIETVIYDDYMQPNMALAEHEIDLNMFQHYTYLNNCKFEHDLDISAIVQIPTASMGIYSSRYRTLDEIADGASIAIPDDSTNLSRALRVLDAAGVITIDPSVDESKATVKDLIKNPKNLQFSFITASMLVQSLDDLDLAVINGNFALSGGLDLSEALYNEKLEDSYINVIAVRTEDLNTPFVRDIIDAVHSEDFIHIIIDPDNKYSGFQRPRSFLNINNQ